MTETERTGEAPSWFKSTYSGGDGGECVEIADGQVPIRIRDSKDPSGPQPAVGLSTRADFVAEVGTTRPI